ncbi:MAG TPA: type IVB secretion system protein IcmJDotN [Patescibacteria group bacterium]|jgi:intracellular multiplication protein IcmJ|nr:type IVB secretion system protein IcmJDotN [Patescibacteria group bacterium]
MPDLQVALGIVRSSANAQSHSKGGPAATPATKESLTQELRQKIYERDDYTCAACGFRSMKYQDVHFMNGNPSDTRADNLVTVCIFCHQCFRLNQVSEMRSGVLIWLPEISQTDLHHIARAIYVARISQGPVAEASRKALDILMQRREEVRKRLGTDDPFILAAVLKDYISDKAYESRSAKLDGIRLFPLDRRIIKEADLEFNQFPQILAYWRAKDGPFGGTVPRQWIDLYREITPSKAA